MDPPTEVVHRVPVAGGTGMWAPENAYLDPAGDVYLLMRSVKLRVSSETLSQYSGTFAKLFGHDNTITPAAHREMVEKVDLHGKELSRTGPPTIHLHEDITWPLVRLCKLAHGQTFVERALPETASPEKCEQYAQEVYELVLAAINYEFRIILPQISKMARQRLKIYADRRPSVSSLARFVSVAYAIEDARLFREATSCMVQVTSGQSLRNALPKSLNQLVPTAHVVGLWDMFHVGRENRRRLVFEKVRQAFDSLITNNYRFGLPHTVNRLAYAQRPSGDFRVGKDFKNQDAKTTIDACETRGLSLREMLLALSQDVHTHLEYLATIAAAEPFDPVRFEFPNEGHKTRAWAWFWQLQCALERIVRENAVGVGGWCLGCFISHRQTELGADDHWQCPHGCYLG